MFSSRARWSLGLLVPLLVWAGPAAAQGTAGRTVDARQLLAIAKGGLTAAATAARTVKNPPFWTAVDAMGHALDTVEAAYLARNPVFFTALGAGSRTLAELRAAWAHSAPATAPAMPAAIAVTAGLDTLSSAYSLLRGSYGWEVLRRQQGGVLTADEERQLQALKRTQAALASRLTAIRNQATRAGDRRAAADLARLIAQARSIAAAHLTLDAYLAALQSAEALQGEWAGDSHYVKPAVRKAMKKAAPLVEDLATDPGVGFVFTADLSQAESWAPLDTPVEVPAGVELGGLGPEADTLPAAAPAVAPTESEAEDAQPLRLDPASPDAAEGGMESGAAPPEAPPATDDQAGQEAGKKAAGNDPQAAPAPAAPPSSPAPPAPSKPAPPAATPFPVPPPGEEAGWGLPESL